MLGSGLFVRSQRALGRSKVCRTTLQRPSFDLALAEQADHRLEASSFDTTLAERAGIVAASRPATPVAPGARSVDRPSARIASNSRQPTDDAPGARILRRLTSKRPESRRRPTERAADAQESLQRVRPRCSWAGNKRRSEATSIDACSPVRNNHGPRPRARGLRRVMSDACCLGRNTIARPGSLSRPRRLRLRSGPSARPSPGRSSGPTRCRRCRP